MRASAKDKLEELNHQLEIAERTGDYEGASRIKYGDLPGARETAEVEAKQAAVLTSSRRGRFAACCAKTSPTTRSPEIVVSQLDGDPGQPA